jgi:hypothetical protein
MVAPFTVVLTALVAAPLVYFLRGRLSFVMCCIFGFAIGVVGVLAFWLVTNRLAALHWSPLLLIAGLASAVIFWMIGVRGNRDLTIGSSDRGVALSMGQGGNR